MNLTNQATGNVLKIFLIIGMILGGILALTNFFYAYLYEVYLLISWVDWAVSISNSVIWFITCIIYLIWIYKVHTDLRLLNPDYPITPLGSIARIIIPFYNLYGLWNIFSTMSRYFEEHNKTFNIGNRLGLIIPFYYILFLGTEILNRSIVASEVPNIHLFVISFILDLILVVIFYFMVKDILKALPIIQSELTEKNRNNQSINS
ncbi:hypothetical protein [Oceanobacillus sp. J11TS1]|uniref:hypothetical protein n=1 Tax=Oceanobacillus sp. J11TS1 TaxID=2807191 RepID=UPI001B09E856|nr:hypothetical protein [Oceanobacillus sp. J11TS1]GIO22254.1 hypothetical protein J11TS1_08350 [Oceanobacillus sp. J11TS1]